MRPSKKILSPSKGEVWWSSNFVKVLEIEFPPKKSDTFSETIQKILSPRKGEAWWSSNKISLKKVWHFRWDYPKKIKSKTQPNLIDLFPPKKSDTFGETIQKIPSPRKGRAWWSSNKISLKKVWQFRWDYPKNLSPKPNLTYPNLT